MGWSTYLNTLQFDYDAFVRGIRPDHGPHPIGDRGRARPPDPIQRRLVPVLRRRSAAARMVFASRSRARSNSPSPRSRISSLLAEAARAPRASPPAPSAHRPPSRELLTRRRDGKHVLARSLDPYRHIVAATRLLSQGHAVASPWHQPHLRDGRPPRVSRRRARAIASSSRTRRLTTARQYARSSSIAAVRRPTLSYGVRLNAISDRRVRCSVGPIVEVRPVRTRGVTVGVAR